MLNLSILVLSLSAVAFGSGQAETPSFWTSRDLLREEELEVGDYICTATLLDSINILTAAHCFRQLKDDELGGVFMVGGKPAKLVKISPEYDLAWLFYPTKTRSLSDLCIRQPKRREHVFTARDTGAWAGEVSTGEVTKIDGPIIETNTFITGGKSGSGIYAASDGALVGLIIRCQPSAYSKRMQTCMPGTGNIAVSGAAILEFLERPHETNH